MEGDYIMVKIRALGTYWTSFLFNTSFQDLELKLDFYGVGVKYNERIIENKLNKLRRLDLERLSSIVRGAQTYNSFVNEGGGVIAQTWSGDIGGDVEILGILNPLLHHPVLTKRIELRGLDGE